MVPYCIYYYFSLLSNKYVLLVVSYRLVSPSAGFSFFVNFSMVINSFHLVTLIKNVLTLGRPRRLLLLLIILLFGGVSPYFRLKCFRTILPLPRSRRTVLLFYTVLLGIITSKVLFFI